MPNTKQPLPEWERLLSAAAHLQRILPGAVLVGGTAVATHVHHRLSRNFIVMVQMFNVSGRNLIELNWGKITYKEPSLELFTLPNQDGEVPVAKSMEDIGDIYGVELPNRESWMKRHLTVILVGLAVVVLVVGVAVKFRRR